jgi:hypothetical protein
MAANSSRKPERSQTSSCRENLEINLYCNAASKFLPQYVPTIQTKNYSISVT